MKFAYKNSYLMILFILFLFSPSISHCLIYFQENFNNGDVPYSFESSRFGYSDNPIQTYHDSEGGVNNSGSHRIPLGGSGRTNFDIHFQKSLPNLTSYYVRFYLWVNPTFNTNPGANWKLTYNYTESAGFVFWMRPADRRGFQPAMYSAANNDTDIFRTQNVPTFYLSNFKGQWICFEYYVSLPERRVKLWITTPGGEYNQTLYIDSNFINSGTRFSSLKIGAYWDGTGDSNFFKIDEVVIADQYIGPLNNGGPANQPPLNPSGLRIVGGQ